MDLPFEALVASPPSGRTTALLLDHSGYGSRRLLRGGQVPWTEPASCANYFGQAQGLLLPDTTLVDVGEAYAQHLALRPDLCTDMAARSRIGYSLKTLLADQEIADSVHTLVRVLCETSRQPLILQVPSPLRWLITAQEAIGSDATGIEIDHGEAASIYMSDWLRRFDSLPIAMLLLDGRHDDEPALEVLADENLAAYTPLINAAGHYRWSLGIRTDASVEMAGDVQPGVVVPETFWNDESAAPSAAFRIANIPADIEPERVLARLDDLR